MNETKSIADRVSELVKLKVFIYQICQIISYMQKKCIFALSVNVILLWINDSFIISASFYEINFLTSS